MTIQPIPFSLFQLLLFKLQLQPLIPYSQTDILLRLPIKSLLRFMCVSKSWHQLISSSHFVNTHMKLNTHHRLLFPPNVKSCSLPSLFHKEHVTELLHMNSSVENPMCIMDSVNGLICLFNHAFETYIWNPTVNNSKKLPNSTWGSSYSTKFGFGYDESRDDYKTVFIDYFRTSSRTVVNISTLKIVVNIYCLRTDSWRTVHDQLKGIFLLNHSGKFINGKRYWASSTSIGNSYMRNIISFDLVDETWGSVELPIRGENNPNSILGVMGNDLSLLYTCDLGATTSDVWIVKDCGFWTKLFTISYPQFFGRYMFSSPIYTFSICFRELNKGEILLSLLALIMICDGSTRQLKHTVDVEGFNTAEIYVVSLVDPLMISGQGRCIHETSQSLS